MDESINPNIIVRGFMGNVGKSGHGIHCLGVRVGKYVLETVDKLNKKYKVDRISFIGHSLGGPTQSMAVRYISIKRPDFFDAVKGVKPVNFITLASPFIGVIGDFPFYLSVPLDMGALGLTGRDLNLKYTPLTSKDGLYADDEVYPEHSKYILEILPQAPAKKVFESFKRRTIYANVMDDGIVPLRTAALLYLDWRSIHKVQKIRKKIRTLQLQASLCPPIAQRVVEHHHLQTKMVTTSGRFLQKVQTKKRRCSGLYLRPLSTEVK